MPGPPIHALVAGLRPELGRSNFFSPRCGGGARGISAYAEQQGAGPVCIEISRVQTNARTRTM